MPTAKTLHLDTIQIPITDETDWGAEVSAFLATYTEDLDEIAFQDSDGNVFSRLSVTTTTFAAGATLTPSSSYHRVQGTSGAVTLDATTAITDGEKDGQTLLLKGTNDTNTVTINDGANTAMNGNVTLAKGDVIEFVWDDTSSEWVERSRTN